MKEAAVIAFVAAIVLSGAPTLALLLMACALVLAVAAWWP
jgi:hypothetical protein